MNKFQKLMHDVCDLLNLDQYHEAVSPIAINIYDLEIRCGLHADFLPKDFLTDSGQQLFSFFDERTINNSVILTCKAKPKTFMTENEIMKKILELNCFFSHTNGVCCGYLYDHGSIITASFRIPTEIDKLHAEQFISYLDAFVGYMKFVNTLLDKPQENQLHSSSNFMGQDLMAQRVLHRF